MSQVPPAAKCTILVVDDEPLVRFNAVDIFEEMGFEVIEAADGVEALAILESRSDIGLLFSDCRMPRMTGPELAAVASRRWPNLRIVLVTGYVSAEDVKDWPLLWKPYKAEDIQRIVAHREVGAKRSRHSAA
ncbi:response regulator [Antarcticirhabdus aurantiaca]|uniref:Response regulator n=1 Tax=Antarcticirhabdus aurantiaca TaxID=2606717 RepID=A0ACD4NTG9_9HYPH|nr:response regulator [Antarcticirhabdus aurantiaca]WAJ29996.1 response regulator [Jeongeuplla avenae]